MIDHAYGGVQKLVSEIMSSHGPSDADVAVTPVPQVFVAGLV